MLVPALLIGLGTMKLVELYKEVTRRISLHQAVWFRSIVALPIAAALSFSLVGGSTHGHLLLTFSACGIAMLGHALDTALRALLDEHVSNVLGRRAPPPRR
jgi:hypothetical protein